MGLAVEHAVALLLRKPVAPSLRAKAHNQRAHALPRGIFESLLQLDANPSLMRRRILRRFLAEDREGVRAIVVDRTRQQYPRTAGLPAAIVLSIIGKTNLAQFR